ncbi:MAG: UDP-N-acetylglucosamine--N-acetylmuramyl-(pentapeptide) pyrophosphoryl-undecaprenol N-acetylglucosamine transferase, partial [Starkeya sp.]|nr:UDP-N-acetylglucosamine--N-acetylmuramyl-(pentapeptide) pyrophosphoryl-undecaprenol N-acetylglucosamine transferase [Starkeya sp.]
ADEPGRLEAMASAARVMGRADAAERLATLVIAVGKIHV